MESASFYEKDATGMEIKRSGLFKRKLDISWGAILAGWLVAAAAAMILYVLGAATGISAIRLSDPDSITDKMIFSATVWLMVTWVISLALGAYFAGAVTRTTDKKVGCLQGIAIWALSSLLTILVGMTGLGLAGVGVAGTSGQIIGGSLIAAESANGQETYNNPANFRAVLKREIAPKLNEDLRAGTLSSIAAEFIRGDKENAKNALLLNTTLSNEDAEMVVNDLSQQIATTKEKVKIAADKAAYYTAVALWLSVLVSLLSLAGAMWGGKAGVRDFIKTCCGHSDKEKVME